MATTNYFATPETITVEDSAQLSADSYARGKRSGQNDAICLLFEMAIAEYKAGRALHGEGFDRAAKALHAAYEQVQA